MENDFSFKGEFPPLNKNNNWDMDYDLNQVQNYYNPYDSNFNYKHFLGLDEYNEFLYNNLYSQYDTLSFKSKENYQCQNDSFTLFDNSKEEQENLNVKDVTNNNTRLNNSLFKQEEESNKKENIEPNPNLKKEINKSNQSNKYPKKKPGRISNKNKENMSTEEKNRSKTRSDNIIKRSKNLTINSVILHANKLKSKIFPEEKRAFKKISVEFKKISPQDLKEKKISEIITQKCCGRSKKLRNINEVLFKELKEKEEFKQFFNMKFSEFVRKKYLLHYIKFSPQETIEYQKRFIQILKINLCRV